MLASSISVWCKDFDVQIPETMNRNTICDKFAAVSSIQHAATKAFTKLVVEVLVTGEADRSDCNKQCEHASPVVQLSCASVTRAWMVAARIRSQHPSHSALRQETEYSRVASTSGRAHVALTQLRPLLQPAALDCQPRNEANQK